MVFPNLFEREDAGRRAQSASSDTTTISSQLASQPLFIDEGPASTLFSGGFSWAAHITEKPGVCGGAPILVGTRVAVHTIVELVHCLGWSADRVVEEYPYLGKDQVQAALEYYKTNGKLIDKLLAQEREV